MPSSPTPDKVIHEHYHYQIPTFVPKPGNRVAKFFGRPIIIRRINGWIVIFWLALVVPTIWIWSESILWVAVLSIWANVVGHYTAWLAARVEVRSEHVEDVIK